MFMDFKKEQIKVKDIHMPKIKKANRISESKMIGIISNYSGEEFESFLFEWLRFCKKDIDEDSLLFRIGGTGDNGVDIYYKNKEEIVYYQAKQYNHQLTLNEIIDIVSKIFWYVFKGKIDYPTKIFVISSKGISSKSVFAFTNPIKLKQVILGNLKQTLKRNKINYEEQELIEFSTFFQNKDLSIVKNIQIDKIIYDYYCSELGVIRFTKQEPFRLRIKIKREDYDDELFIKQIKSVYAKSKTQNLVVSDAKDSYYNCLCLKETDRFLYGNNVEFDLVKEDIYESVNFLFYNETIDVKERYVTCLDKAAQSNINISLLGDYGLNMVTKSDKKGICQMLVNEKKISWEKKDE